MIRYIPFLKAKRGELTAMGELAPNVKQAICPFFDFPRKKPDYDAKGYAANARGIATSLKKHWGTKAELYFDDLDIAQTLKVEGLHQYAYVLKALKGLQVIPVVGLDRPRHNDVVTQLKRDGEIASTTVAFRAEQRDFEDFEATGDHIDYDLAAVFKQFETIDLILDCRLCTGMNAVETAQQIANFAHKFCMAYGNVRRVIVAGSSIPPTIGSIVSLKSSRTVLRQELEIIAKASALSEYEVIGGDYTTVGPFFSDAEFEPYLWPKVTAPKLIYTFDHSHYIARGISLEKGGRDQYFGLITELWKKPFFRQGDSSGENYFHDKIRRIGSKATNATVVKPSVVAHITYMVLRARS